MCAVGLRESVQGRVPTEVALVLPLKDMGRIGRHPAFLLCVADGDDSGHGPQGCVA